MKVKIDELKKGQWTEIEFKKMYSEMQKNNIPMIEKEVLIGKTHQLKSRLIIHLMPSQEIEKRIRKARLNAKKKRRNSPTKNDIARLHLNLFITNTDSNVIQGYQVWSLYRLRWQIELLFKIWKSICHIEKVKRVKKERLECYIFSKLLLILMLWSIVWEIARH